MFEKVYEKNGFIYIQGLVDHRFLADLQRVYKTSRISKLFSEIVLRWTGFQAKINSFFGPELLFISQELYEQTKRRKYRRIVEGLKTETWVGSLYDQNIPNKVKISKLQELYFTPKAYQLDFVQTYCERKERLELDGFILSYEQGLGKTYTSLALMHCLNKDLVIIIAPKTTLHTVWKNEIETVFKKPQEIYVVGDRQIPKNCRFAIFNYEALNKVAPILSKVPHRNLGIIVDECHNFKTYGNKRVTELLRLKNETQCTDCLLMSGTPVKALGGELVPALAILDPKFNADARAIWLKVFGVNVPIALSIVKHRLGMMMLRKLKVDVLNLPSKTNHNIDVTIPNGKDYTLPEVKKELIFFMKDRMNYYVGQMPQIRDRFKEIIENFIREFPGYEDQARRYLNITNTLHKGGEQAHKQMAHSAPHLLEEMKAFEKTILEPNLSSEERKEFRKIKAAYKYVKLKVFGEAMGSLQHMRRDMFKEIVHDISDMLARIIRSAEKKTVIFTTFVDVLKMANEEMMKKKFTPLVIYGENVNERNGIIKQFRQNPGLNPLIATVQTLSTGVTLIEANTVIFLNTPWRYVDRVQAEDRVHRLGQDVDVNIYNIVLKTGNEANLSTRLEEIVKWSEEMFDAMVGISPETKDVLNRLIANKILG